MSAPLDLPIAPVQCGSCHACCRGQLVTMMDADTPLLSHYKLREVGHGLLALQHKPNGDCAHLGPDGCDVWPLHPTICRAFDCVAQFKQYSRVQRRRMLREGHASVEVFAAARARL